MKLIALNGSRGNGGRTAKCADAFIESFKKAGGEASLYYVPRLAVERCRQCNDDGWGDCLHKGKCVIDDDFQKLTGEIREADALFLATPVYWGELSESLRAYLDRLRRVALHKEGKKDIAGKPVYAVCVAGGGGGASFECVSRMERIVGDIGMDLVDAIPARRQNLDLKVEQMKSAGAWFAGYLKSSR